jgi:GAF domain-containing protein
MLAHAMALEGTAAKALPPSAIAAERITELRLDTVQVLCLTYFHGDPTSHARYVCRRLRRLHPALRILLVCWQSDTPQADPGTARALGADALAVTLDEALMQLRAWAGPDADTARALVANAVTDAAGGGPATGAPATGSADAPLRLAALDMALRAPFDHAAQRAADVFGMPLALVGLFDGDRVTWVGRAGALDERLWPATWPRQGPCDEVKASGSTLVVPDLQRDPRFVQPGPWHEAGLRYYAAAPLRVGAPPAPPVGTLCLLDTRPRQLSAAELGLLATMADELSSLLRANVDSVYEASASMASAKPDARATDGAPPAPTGGQGASSPGVAWPPGGVPA